MFAFGGPGKGTLFYFLSRFVIPYLIFYHRKKCSSCWSPVEDFVIFVIILQKDEVILSRKEAKPSLKIQPLVELPLTSTEATLFRKFL